MYFPDLTPYQYVHSEPKFSHIGWLKSGADFPTGRSSPEFSERLLQLCRHPVNLCRGFHTCDLCPPPGKREFDFGYGPRLFRADTRQYHLKDGRSIWTCQLVIQRDEADTWLGNGEVEVAGQNGQGYRAPTLIYHYVTVHQYKPPDEFVEAVMTSLSGNTP